MLNENGRGYTISEIDDDVIVEVLDRVVARHKRGMETYGISMEDEYLPSTGWIDHTIEELLDAVNYLTKLKRTLNVEKKDKKSV